MVHLRLQLIIAVVVFLLASGKAQTAAYTQSDCSSGTFNLNGVEFGSSSFNFGSTCIININGGTATNLHFSPINEVKLTIRNLQCQSADGERSCIKFGSVGGTSATIDIDSVTWTAASSGNGVTKTAVLFESGVVAHRISITRVAVSCDMTASSGDGIGLELVHFRGTVTFSNMAGSLLNVSLCSLVGRAEHSAGGTQIFYVIMQYALTQLEHFEMTSNRVALTATCLIGNSIVNMFLLYAIYPVTLTGTDAAAIIMYNNSYRGSTWKTTGVGTGIQVYGPTFLGAVSQVSKFVVDTVDMRDMFVESRDSWARVVGLSFKEAAASLSMTGSAIAEIKNIWIGGQMTYVFVYGDDKENRKFGVQGLEFAGTLSFSRMLVADCSIDFSAGAGLRTNGSDVPAMVRVAQFYSPLSSPRLIFSNNSIHGTYSAQGDTAWVEVRLVQFRGAVSNMLELRIVDCVVTAHATCPLGNPRVDLISFLSTIDNSKIHILNLDCGAVQAGHTDCVFFKGRMDGTLTELRISNVKRTYKAASGDSYTIRFESPVAAHVISISAVEASFEKVSSAANIQVKPIWFMQSATGSGASGSQLNVSANSFSGSIGGNDLVQFFGVFLGNTVDGNEVSNFETVELSGNKMAFGMSFESRGPGALQVSLIQVNAKIVGGASAVTKIIIRNNAMHNVSVTASGQGSGTVRLVEMSTISAAGDIIIQRSSMRGLTAADNNNNNKIESVAVLSLSRPVGATNISVSDVDARQLSLQLTHATRGTFSAVLIGTQAAITLTGSNQAIVVDRVWIGGTHSCTGSEQQGVRAVHVLGALTSVASRIAVTNSYLDFAAGAGMTTSATNVPVIARIASFAVVVSGVQSLVFDNNMITGRYSAGAAHVDAAIVHFNASVTGTTSNDDVLSVAGSSIHGNYASGSSYVCVGIAVFNAPAAALSDVERKISTGAVMNAQTVDIVPYSGINSTDNIFFQCGSMTTFTSTTWTSTPYSSTSEAATTTTILSSTNTTSESPPSTTTTTIEAQTTNATATTTTAINTTTTINTTTSTETTANSTNSTGNVTLSPERRAFFETPGTHVLSAATTAASTTLSMFASPSAAGNMRNLAAAGSLLLCFDDAAKARAAILLGLLMPPPPPLEWDSNLFALSIGQEKFETYGACVVSSIVALFSVLAIGAIAAFLRSRFGKTDPATGHRYSLQECLRKVHHPGTVGLAVPIVCPPLMTAGIILVAHPLSGGAVIGVIGIIFAVLPLLCYLALARHFDANEKLLGGDADGEDAEQQEQQQPDITSISATLLSGVDFLTAPRREYKKSLHVDLYKFMVEGHASVYYAAAELAVELGLSILSGMSACCISTMCCHISAYGSCAVALAYLLVILVKRPYLVRWDSFNNPTMMILIVLTTVLAVIASHNIGGDGVGDAVELATQIIFYLALISLLMDMVANSLPPIVWLCSKVCSFPIFKLLQQRADDRESKIQATATATDAREDSVPLIPTSSRLEQEQQQQQQEQPQNLQQLITEPQQCRNNGTRGGRSDDAEDGEQMRDVLMPAAPRRQSNAAASRGAPAAAVAHSSSSRRNTEAAPAPRQQSTTSRSQQQQQQQQSRQLRDRRLRTHHGNDDDDVNGDQQRPRRQLQRQQEHPRRGSSASAPAAAGPSPFTTRDGTSFEYYNPRAPGHKPRRRPKPPPGVDPSEMTSEDNSEDERYNQYVYRQQATEREERRKAEAQAATVKAAEDAVKQAQQKELLKELLDDSASAATRGREHQQPQKRPLSRHEQDVKRRELL